MSERTYGAVIVPNDHPEAHRGYRTPKGSYLSIWEEGTFVCAVRLPLGMAREDGRLAHAICNGTYEGYPVTEQEIRQMIESACLPPETKENLLWNLENRNAANGNDPEG